MQRVKIFIASSSESLKMDILEIEAFILRLNNSYIDYGLYFSPVLSSALSGSGDRAQDQSAREGQSAGEGQSASGGKVASGGHISDAAQQRYAAVSECSAAFFVVDGDGDEDIREIYKAARDSYHKNGRPRIAVYIKQGSNLQFPNSEFYTNNYKHADTLKLGILMQIKQLGLPGVDIQLGDGKARQGADILLSLDNVESIAGFENLQNLKIKRSELECRFYSAKTRYAENPGDDAAYEEFFEASRQRSEAIQEIRDIETQLYNIMEGLYEETAHGRLSRRQTEGYRLIERGMLNEARDVLDFYAIVSESRSDEEMVEQAAKRAQVHIKELMQLKDVSVALFDWESVDACYKEAVRLEEKHGLPRKSSVDYMLHLISQWKHDEAAALGEELRHYYQSPGSAASDEDMSFLLNQLGGVYGDTQQIDKAEEALKASLAIRQARTDGDPDKIEGDIAIVYNNLGYAYSVSGRNLEAIEAHTSALEIRKKLAARNPEVYEAYLAYSYVNLGAAFSEEARYEESVAIMKSARDIFEKLAVLAPNPHEAHLTICCINLGGAYVELNLIAEAEDSLGTARETLMKLAESNPGAYEPRLAFTHYRFGSLYAKAKRYAQAEENYNNAVKMYERIIGRSSAFEAELVKCYHSMGELFIETKRWDEATDMLNSAIRLYKKYEANPGYAELVLKAQKLLDGMSAAQLAADTGASPDAIASQEAMASMFTPEEKEVALLLTEGLSQREISRKLNIPIADVALRVGAIRGKMSGADSSDPVINSVVVKYKLSKRETDMLVCLRDGASTEKIAEGLFITEDTVRSHVFRLLKKLGIDNRQAVPAWLKSYIDSM